MTQSIVISSQAEAEACLRQWLEEEIARGNNHTPSSIQFVEVFYKDGGRRFWKFMGHWEQAYEVFEDGSVYCYDDGY